MRASAAAIAALIFLGAPAAAVQPTEVAQADRQLTEMGRWTEQLSEALMAGMESQRELNQGMRALVAPPVSRERIIAGAPALRPLIERNRADLRRSNALLDALPTPPADLGAETGRQLVADARAYNAGLSVLLDSFEDFLVAVGKGDIAAMERVAPRIAEGAFALVGQQRLLIRNRQASFEPTDSTHQSLGVVGQLYRAMEAALRHSMTAKENNGARADTAASALRRELRLIAAETRSVAATGRRNLAREIAEIDAEQRATRDPAEARLLDRVRNVYAGEGKVFDLADRLVAYAEAHQAVTGARLRDPSAPPLLPPLAQMEADYMAITQAQAEALAKGQ